MGGCAVPDTSRLHDHHAERMILCGLLHNGRPLVHDLDEIGLCVSDFYDDLHQKAYDLFTYVAQGNLAPILSASFEEIVVRRTPAGFLDGRFERYDQAATWLFELWFLWMWLNDEPGKDGWRKGMFFWAVDHPGVNGTPFEHIQWAALAAAAKVKHLSARRVTIYRALEAIRDATDGIVDGSFGDEV